MLIGIYKKYGLLLTVAVSLCLFAQSDWDNPSEKYIHAYKAFIDERCSLKKDEIQHFVYFARGRASLKHHPMVSHKRFVGGQIMYSWAQDARKPVSSAPWHNRARW